MSAAITKRYIVIGKVQGVGFRYFVKKSAVKLRVTGSVQNLPDNSVAVEITGNDNQHYLLESQLKKGSRYAEVGTVITIELEAKEFIGFSILY